MFSNLKKPWTRFSTAGVHRPSLPSRTVSNLLPKLVLTEQLQTQLLIVSMELRSHRSRRRHRADWMHSRCWLKCIVPDNFLCSDSLERSRLAAQELRPRKQNVRIRNWLKKKPTEVTINQNSTGERIAVSWSNAEAECPVGWKTLRLFPR
jgi:hypothetical protein